MTVDQVHFICFFLPPVLRVTEKKIFRQHKKFFPVRLFVNDFRRTIFLFRNKAKSNKQKKKEKAKKKQFPSQHFPQH